ncbi:MlaD family protein [Geomonas sp.]|uniref:MlaD family protein n=1 Tax=Geomonas sp. TaxID=2651584 RepID=UPI002B4842EB|nr:MlaD family protein [Geomonas sp.]HJV35584.1 MlaD family protein [Geomonas sp.]
MGTKVSKTAIGAFVLGAIALLVATVLVLGAGKFFTTLHSYITYFDGSVKGLNVGSPVMFQGVKVGEVTDIGIIADQRTRTLHIPVLFDVEPAKFKGTTAKFQNDPAEIEKAVKQLGLRTQLQSLSFVTGQLMVALDFQPNTPAVYVGLDKKHIEIPSVPTPLEKLQKTLEDLPFKEIVENLNSAMQGINQLVRSVDARRTTKTIEAAIRDVQVLVKNLNDEIGPLASHIGDTSQSAQAALDETKVTMAAARGDIKDLVTTSRATLDSAQAALKQSEVTLQAYSADARLTTELNKTLRELSATSRSFRNLSDYLERHPESLLRGKAAAKGE